jgi:hypothetical protein
MGSTTHPFLIKLTNLTKPKLMKINVPQIYNAGSDFAKPIVLNHVNMLKRIFFYCGTKV